MYLIDVVCETCDMRIRRLTGVFIEMTINLLPLCGLTSKCCGIVFRPETALKRRLVAPNRIKVSWLRRVATCIPAYVTCKGEEGWVIDVHPSGFSGGYNGVFADGFAQRIEHGGSSMTHDELIHRINRVYAAVDQRAECDMAKLPAKVINNGNMVGFFQDFSGELSREDIENVAYTMIGHIACMRDHLDNWASANGKDASKIWTVFKNSFDLRVIQDLYNSEKHGYPLTKGEWSKRSPKLVDIRRQMQLTTQAKVGSWVGITSGPGGIPKILGDGNATAIITGEVVDGAGNRIDDLIKLADRALGAWETLLNDFGVLLPARPGV